MKPTRQLHDLGQSIWLDNITRELLNSGTLKRYIDELSVTGLTSNPTIFDHAIKNSTTYDAAIRESCASGKSGEELFLRAGAGGLDAAPPTCSGRSTSAPTASTAGSRWRCRRCWRTTPPARWRRPRSCMTRGASPTCSSRFPAPGRPAGHRGGDLRRRAGQRHAAVLARAICGGGGGVSARHRAAHRRRAQSGGRVGRVAVHQPLGRRGGGQGAGGAAQPARHRDRAADLQGLSRAARLAALAARRQRRGARRSACCGPAPAPRIPRRPTSSTSRRWPRRSPSTPCPRPR